MAGYWIAKRKELLEKETGTINKVDLSVKLVLCFPNSYFIGMSNLGFHSAYAAFNEHPEVRAERAFYENSEEPVCLESGRALNAYNVIGFSVSFELDFENIAHILKIARINPNRQMRAKNDPLIFVGGFTTFFNIKPLYPIVDFALTGESETVFPLISEALVEYHNSVLMTKFDFLKKISGISGVFVPGLSKQYKPLILEDLNPYDTCSKIVSSETEFKDMFLVELARGCFHACNFCVSGHVYSKPRVRTIDNILRMCEEGAKVTDRFGFIAAAPSDYPALDELCDYFEERRSFISFSSLRATSVSKRLLQFLFMKGQKSITLAPESGSEKLRYAVNKKISDNVFFEVVNNAAKTGFFKLKLYMMIGLPEETNEDLEKTVIFLEKIAKILPVAVSLTPFVPKPCTPFAEYEIVDKKILKNKIMFLRKALRLNKRIALRFDGVATAHKQAKFAKGDESLLEKYL